MKKILLSLAAILISIGMFAEKQTVKQIALNSELTLEQAKASTTGFVITDGTNALCATKDGDPKVSLVELSKLKVAYLFKMQDVKVTISDVEKTYQKLYMYKADETLIAAGDNFSAYGGGGNFSPVGWGDLWCAPEAKENGRDFVNGSCWTFTETGDGAYYLYSVGSESYLYNASINKDSKTKWHFYSIKTIEVEVDVINWTCPEGETDITTLPWVNKGQNCNNIFNESTGNVYGTDAGTGKDKTDPISYVDVSNYGSVKIYGAEGSAVRLFINREEAEKADKTYQYNTAEIGESGYVTVELAEIYKNLPDAEYIHLNGVKAGPNWNSTATVYGITLTPKPEPYKITTSAGKIGTIVLDYNASVEGATLYEVASWDANTGLTISEVEGNLQAATPYIYIASASNVTFTKKSASVSHGDYTDENIGNGLRGMFVDLTPSTWWYGYITGSYIISNGELRQINKGSITVPANRCFFDPDKCTNKAAAKAITSPTEEATAIKNVNTALEGGKIYDMNGREVKSMKKGGIYVVGGMKVSVK